MIGIKVANGVEVSTGDTVELRIRNPHQPDYTIVYRGRIEYRADEIATYGCGYAIITARGQVVYLSSIPRYANNQLLVIREEQIINANSSQSPLQQANEGQ